MNPISPSSFSYSHQEEVFPDEAILPPMKKGRLANSESDRHLVSPSSVDTPVQKQRKERRHMIIHVKDLKALESNLFIKILSTDFPASTDGLKTASISYLLKDDAYIQEDENIVRRVRPSEPDIALSISNSLLGKRHIDE